MHDITKSVGAGQGKALRSLAPRPLSRTVMKIVTKIPNSKN